MTDERAPRPPHRHGHHALVLLCVLAHSALTGCRVAVSLQALALGAPAFAFGALLASFAIVPTLASLAMGRWVDRVGTRRPVLAGLALQFAGLALAAAWPQSLGLLAVTALCSGAGYSLALLALQRQLGQRDEPQRSAAFASFGIGTSLSIGLGPFVAGHGFAGGGAAFTFALLAGFVLLAGLGAAFGRRGLRGSGSERAASTASTGGVVLHDAALRRILVADLLMALGWNANGFLLPLFAAQQGWSAATVGDLGAVFGLGVGLVRLGSAAWRRRVGDWTTIRGTLAVAAACFLLLPLLPTLAWTLLLQFVLGAGLGIALPSVMALLHARSPAGRHGEALGLRIVMLNASYLAVPLLLGGLGAAAGVTVLLWSLGGGLSIGAAVLRRG